MLSTGERPELFEIFEKWISGNEGRETADASMSLDYGHELLDSWELARDRKLIEQIAGGAFDRLHFGCDNPDHYEAYKALAIGLGLDVEER